VHKGKDKSYYDYNQNNIGDGPSAFSDGHLSDQACQYMFIDSYNNVIINPHGLFERAFVFTQMTGIAHKTKTYPHAAEQNFTASAAAAFRSRGVIE